MKVLFVLFHVEFTKNISTIKTPVFNFWFHDHYCLLLYPCNPKNVSPLYPLKTSSSSTSSLIPSTNSFCFALASFLYQYSNSISSIPSMKCSNRLKSASGVLLGNFEFQHSLLDYLTITITRFITPSLHADSMILIYVISCKMTTWKQSDSKYFQFASFNLSKHSSVSPLLAQ